MPQLKPKKTVDLKRVPLEAQAILRELSEEVLVYMATIAIDPKFENLIKLTRQLIDRNKDLVFKYPEMGEPWKLAVFKANARGQVGALTNLIYVFKGADHEIARREKK